MSYKKSEGSERERERKKKEGTMKCFTLSALAAGLPLWRKTSPLVLKLLTLIVVILISLPIYLRL